MIELAPGQRLIVIGGDYRQASYWARWESGLTADQVVIVNEPRHLMGIRRGALYVLVGSYWDRRDTLEFTDMLLARDATQLV